MSAKTRGDVYVERYAKLLNEDYSSIPDVAAAAADMRKSETLIDRVRACDPLALQAMTILMGFSNRVRFGSPYPTFHVWRMRASARCPLQSA